MTVAAPTATTAEPEAEARRTLRRHRAFATGLLLLMAAVTLGTFAMPPGWATDLLQASAKAGFVGGIADWFAVTALFRHPLGIPIPHTAIIPAQKARLGRALGNFIAGHVFTPTEVSRVVGQLDISAILSRFLLDPAAARPAATALAGLMPRLMATVGDGRARRLFSRLAPRLVGGPGAGRIVARALRTLVAGGQHQAMLDFLLARVRILMDERGEQLHGFIEEKVRAQGGRIVGWVLGAQIADRVLGTLREEMERAGPDGSNIRAAFDEWIRREIDRMEDDPERAAEIGRALRSVVAHETVQAWLWDIWSRLRIAVEADAARPNGHTLAALEAMLANLGQFLREDAGARTRLQGVAEAAVSSVLPSAREQISTFVGSVVAGWDTPTLVDRLELRVGRDLQYVRINGTVVGFLVGGLLFGALRLAFGPVAF